MGKYYRIVDIAPTIETNVPMLVSMGAVHYATIMGFDITVRSFVIKLDEEDILFAKLCLAGVTIEPLAEIEYNSLKVSGYIK